MSVMGKLKRRPDDVDEVRDVDTFRDSGQCHLTAVARFAPEVALGVVNTLTAIVRMGHESAAAGRPDGDGVVRAQKFEEGDVYMLESPFGGFFADRYLMDFYDVNQRGVCSRMHLHTGLRFVRMMTGPNTTIRVASLSPFVITDVKGVTTLTLNAYVDEIPGSSADSTATRYNVTVEENCWVDLQIPRGVSHQFNAIGEHAVIDSVHPEESIEVLREQMSGCTMMAQTIFLAAARPPATSCNGSPRESVAKDVRR